MGIGIGLLPVSRCVAFELWREGFGALSLGRDLGAGAWRPLPSMASDIGRTFVGVRDTIFSSLLRDLPASSMTASDLGRVDFGTRLSVLSGLSALARGLLASMTIAVGPWASRLRRSRCDFARSASAGLLLLRPESGGERFDVGEISGGASPSLL